jgi:hypothetical protein
MSNDRPKHEQILTGIRSRLHILVAGVLIVAAALKSYSLIHIPSPSQLFFGSLLPSWLLVILEFVVAGMLLVFPNAIWLRNFCIMLFFAFLQYSIYLIFIDDGFCHCFGFVSFPPVTIATLDSLCIFALIVKQEASRKVRFDLAMLSTFVLIALGVSYQFRPIDISELERGGVNNPVILKPNEWVGHELPVWREVGGYEEAVVGAATLIFHQKECPKCNLLLSQLTSFEQSTATIVLIEVPPYANSEHADTSLPKLRLSDDYDWFIQTPSVVLVDGKKVLKLFTDADVQLLKFIESEQ